MTDIQIINDYSLKLAYKTKTMVCLINEMLNSENKTAKAISVILTNREYLSSFKKKYFNVDQFTDVIAFNLEEANDDIDGEVYISIDDVIENSEEYSPSFNREFTRVLIHGILHLLGYNDNNVENIKIMKGLEDKYLLNCNNEIIFFK